MLDLDQLKLQYVTDKTDEKTAVILLIQEFQKLLEDIEDLATLVIRREEPRISHDELLAELRPDGLRSVPYWCMKASLALKMPIGSEGDPKTHPLSECKASLRLW